MQGALVIASGLSPVKKKRAEIFLKDPITRKIAHFRNIVCTLTFLIFCRLNNFLPSLTLVIEEDKDDLSEMVAELLLGHPGRNLPELIQAHPDVLHVEEE